MACEMLFPLHWSSNNGCRMSFKLPINIFDLACVVILALGVMAGRKKGMSGELFDLLKWLIVIAGCAALYEQAGSVVAGWLRLSHLTTYLLVYVAFMFVGVVFFNLIKERVGAKIASSDFFGRSEYFLGMAAGLVRYACILLAGLALLNARLFTVAEVKAMEKYQDEYYGSNFFPTWQSAQALVFEQSFAGRWIHNHLNFVLIKPTQPEDATIRRKELALP